MRVGINGFGRMGRLALRAAWGREDLQIVAISEASGRADTMALLLEFDSVQGRWPHSCAGVGESIAVDGTAVPFCRLNAPGEIPWASLGVDLVLERSGRLRKCPALEPHLAGGASRVVVSAPVTDARRRPC